MVSRSCRSVSEVVSLLDRVLSADLEVQVEIQGMSYAQALEDDKEYTVLIKPCSISEMERVYNSAIEVAIDSGNFLRVANNDDQK